MEILYIISLILLGIAFMIFKKSEEKLNFVKWLIIFIVSNLAYNIVIGMVLGLLNITAHIWLLSLINVIVAIALAFKAIKTKDIQKYSVSKFDIVGIFEDFDLDEIEGLGKVKKQALLSVFKSVKKIKEASVEDIARVKGINLNLAEKIKNKLNN